MGTFAYRIIGAAMLDAGMYEGIETDTRATRQAAIVVLLSSLAAGIGATGWSGPRPSTVVMMAGIAVVTWLAWAYLMFQIGGRLLPEPQTATTPGELMRTTGFATAPGLLFAFAAFPRVTIPVFVVGWLWMFAATVTAVKHALDYEHAWRAVAVCALAALLSLAVAFGFGVLFGPTLS